MADEKEQKQTTPEESKEPNRVEKDVKAVLRDFTEEKDEDNEYQAALEEQRRLESGGEKAGKDTEDETKKESAKETKKETKKDEDSSDSGKKEPVAPVDTEARQRIAQLEKRESKKEADGLVSKIKNTQEQHKKAFKAAEDALKEEEKKLREAGEEGDSKAVAAAQIEYNKAHRALLKAESVKDDFDREVARYNDRAKREAENSQEDIPVKARQFISMNKKVLDANPWLAGYLEHLDHAVFANGTTHNDTEYFNNLGKHLAQRFGNFDGLEFVDMSGRRISVAKKKESKKTPSAADVVGDEKGAEVGEAVKAKRIPTPLEIANWEAMEKNIRLKKDGTPENKKDYDTFVQITKGGAR